MWYLLFEACRTGNAVTQIQIHINRIFMKVSMFLVVIVTNVESPIMSPLCTMHGGNGK
jgi:hypothetical protein